MASLEKLSLAPAKRPFGHAFLEDFLIDKNYLNLNHGSFGTYPRQIQEVLRNYQDEYEARPDAWIRYKYKEVLDTSRAAIAKFLNAPVEGIVYLQNATTGINTVLRNLVFNKGDKIVYFDTIYGACERTVAYITQTTPAESVKVKYTYPVSDTWLVEEFKRIVKKEQDAGFNVRIAIYDTIVSLPGVRMPFEALTKACKELGVLSCIDGAHAVGHIELDLTALDPDFFVSNCHKWLYTPRGCAVFYVPVKNQHLVPSTLPTSHGFLPVSEAKFLDPMPPTAKSNFITNFEFNATIDPSPYLTIPAAIAYRESIGGEKAIQDYCFNLALQAGDRAASIFGTKVLENDEGTLGGICLRNILLPLSYEKIVNIAGTDVVQYPVITWMTATMVREHDTFMALVFYDGGWWVRFSAQVYLEIEDYEWGARTLLELCKRAEKGEFLAKSKI